MILRTCTKGQRAWRLAVCYKKHTQSKQLTLMATIPKDYVLPHSPQVKCLDRFSILDLEEDQDGNVPFWPLFQELLKSPVNSSGQLIELLDTISNLVRGSSGDAGDYGTLRRVVDKQGAKFFDALWPKVVRLSLQLPTYFPAECLHVLHSGDEAALSRGQVACLVSHQFMCSLQCPPWRDGFYDFSIWYDSGQRHPAAVEMYLEALIKYFDEIEPPDSLLQAENQGKSVTSAVSYRLHAFAQDDLVQLAWSAKLSELRIIRVDRYSTELQELNFQGPNGGAVVSANKHIGFGQSATQEELFVGSCPEACPAVLFTPSLQDSQALIIDGAQPMLRIVGQRRDISWSALDSVARQGGRMLFMDALEIDELDDSEGLPDLQAENMEREICKAYTSFSSWDGGTSGGTVWSGVWGCGAFHGDPGVKMCVLWIAATLAGRALNIVCDPSHGDFPQRLEEFDGMVPVTWTAQDLFGVLRRIPLKTERGATLQWLIANT